VVERVLRAIHLTRQQADALVDISSTAKGSATSVGLLSNKAATAQDRRVKKRQYWDSTEKRSGLYLCIASRCARRQFIFALPIDAPPTNV